MNLKDGKKLIVAAEAFRNTLKLTNYPPFEDLQLLSEINENIKSNINTLLDFIANREIEFAEDIVEEDEEIDLEPVIDSSPDLKPFEAPSSVLHGFWDEMDPDADWKIIHDMNIMVSDNGMFVSLDNEKVLKPYFIDGDLRISQTDDIKDAKRAAPLVCKAFGIRSNDIKGDYIIEFKDGDRRNLSPSNIYWVRSCDVEKKNSTTLLVEDICRRILEYRGDINKILPLYEGSKPPVTDKLVNGIISGQIYRNISDRFFIVSEGKVFPKADATPKSTAPDGVDVAGFLEISGDKELVKELLKDKLARKHTLSIPDKKVLTFFAIDSMGIRKNDPDPKKVLNVIKNNWGIDSIDIEFIEECAKDYTSELAIAFGRKEEDNE